MNKSIIIIFLILQSQLCYSQDKIIYYKSEFGDLEKSYRSITSCNCYQEQTLWSEDSIVFCNLKGDWIIKINGKWSQLYVDNKYVDKIKIQIDSLEYELVWLPLVVYNDKELRPFHLVSKYVSVSTNSIYFFHPNIGVYGFSADGVKYFLKE